MIEAKIANAHDFISALPQRYHATLEMVEENYQRTTTPFHCPCHTKKPCYSCLTKLAALDSASEKLVQEALEKLMENRTSLVIAHRLSTIQKADKIVVLDKGKRIEEGNHKALMEKDGAYASLVNLQRL